MLECVTLTNNTVSIKDHPKTPIKHYYTDEKIRALHTKRHRLYEAENLSIQEYLQITKHFSKEIQTLRSQTNAITDTIIQKIASLKGELNIQNLPTTDLLLSQIDQHIFEWKTLKQKLGHKNPKKHKTKRYCST